MFFHIVWIKCHVRCAAILGADPVRHSLKQAWSTLQTATNPRSAPEIETAVWLVWQSQSSPVRFVNTAFVTKRGRSAPTTATRRPPARTAIARAASAAESPSDCVCVFLFFLKMRPNIVSDRVEEIEKAPDGAVQRCGRESKSTRSLESRDSFPIETRPLTSNETPAQDQTTVRFWRKLEEKIEHQRALSLSLSLSLSLDGSRVARLRVR